MVDKPIAVTDVSDEVFNRYRRIYGSPPPGQADDITHAEIIKVADDEENERQLLMEKLPRMAELRLLHCVGMMGAVKRNPGSLEESLYIMYMSGFDTALRLVNAQLVEDSVNKLLSPPKEPPKE